jgi:hypothetical protein
MASVHVGQLSVPQAGPNLLACVRDNGSASHPYPASESLAAGPGAARNLADAIHFICALHGRHPSVIELVAARNVDPASRGWLNEAAAAFSRERALLARLAVEAGPVPATPGQGAEAAIAMQRNALLTLAQSERRGCAVGAALAVAADWAGIRKVLDKAANRYGIGGPHPFFNDVGAVADLTDAAAANPSVRRAMLFGAEQVALQHRGMWDLLQARAEARG